METWSLARSSLVVFPVLALMLSACSHQPTASDAVVALPSSHSLVEPPVENLRRAPSAETLSWFAASDADVERAVCQGKVLQTTAEIETYFSQLPRSLEGEDGLRATIAGIEFVDEVPSVLAAFRELVTVVPQKPGALLSKREQEALLKDQNLQQAYAVNPSCSRVLCAVKKIFGESVGPKMLYLMHAYDINTSPLSRETADTFADDEIGDVLRTLRFLPKDLLPFDRNQELLRHKHGEKPPGDDPKVPVVYANWKIRLFDPWSAQSSLRRQYLLFHEFGHRFARNIFENLDETSTWNKTSVGNQSVGSLSPATYVSEYAMAHPYEDFAECVASYRFNPSHLKAKSQVKYDYIRTMVFDGLEFQSAQDCQKPRYSSSLVKVAEASFSAEEKTAAVDKIKSVCRTDLTTALFGALPLSYFAWCADYEATLAWQASRVRQGQAEFKEALPGYFFDQNARRSRLTFPEIRLQARRAIIAELAAQLDEMLQVASRAPGVLSGEDVSGVCQWMEKNAFRLESLDRSQMLIKRDVDVDLSANGAKVSELCRELHVSGAPSKEKIEKYLEERSRNLE